MTCTSTAPLAAPVVPDVDAAIRGLTRETLQHPSVHHPFLAAFARGGYADPAAVLRSYAWEYSGYSAWFPKYLQTVIDRLDRPEHRELLLHNLEEEKGQLGEDDRQALREVGIDPLPLIGVPHPVLFRRFCHAMGIDEQQLATPSANAVRWRTRLMHFLDGASPAAAVGALGLGTEQIVRPIYEQLLAGIRRIPTLRREDYVFFELHCLVDDQHQKDLLEIAKDLATTPDGLRDLRHGMLTALELRGEFWDGLVRNLDRHVAHSA